MSNQIARLGRALWVSAGLTLLTMRAAAAQLPASDREFVTRAVQGNNYELAAARLASSMSMDAAVKAYADMMVNDHSVLASRVKMAVNTADPQFPMPAGLDGLGQAQLDLLQNAGRKFDSTYRAQMIASHTAVRALFQSYVDSDKSQPGIRAVIAGALPTVQKHLDDAVALPVAARHR